MPKQRFSEYYKFSDIHGTHKFMENGRCWHCGIKPDYLGDFIRAYLKGDFEEEYLLKMSECHNKLKVGE